MVSTVAEVDAIVLGGGVYGLTVARALARHGQRTVLVEQETALMRRASYRNQARVHRGYHYPRSVLTAARSSLNYARFIREFGASVQRGISTLYAIASQRSKITARQFEAVCERIGAPLRPASRQLRALFDRRTVEAVYSVEEAVFDATELAMLLKRSCDELRVSFLLGTKARRVHSLGDRLEVELDGPPGPSRLRASKVVCCLYSGTNGFLSASSLPPVRLKHELTEMPLIDVPAELEGHGVTVMCGPFFSSLPFPDRGAYTLSHVHYTPHFEWHEAGAPDPSLHRLADAPARLSMFERMRADASRYLPALSRCRRLGSLWEVKTVLPASESDDSRPIVYRRDHGLRGLSVILGGKVDNVFDVVDELERDLAS